MKVRADLMERIKGQLKTQTEEQKKATEEQLAAAAKVTEAWDKLGAAADVAAAKMITAFGPGLSAVLDSTKTDIENIVKLLKWIEDHTPTRLQPVAPGQQLPKDQPGNPLLEKHPGLAEKWFGLHMATGGIVNRPTMAMIGEAGPEAVVPLGGGGDLLGGTATKENTRKQRGQHQATEDA